MPAGFTPTRIGERRHRLRIQLDSGSTRGADGHIVPVWTTKADVWAKMVQRGAKEFNENAGISADATHLFNVRYLPGLTSKMRATIIGTTRVFNFDGIENVRELNREMNIAAIEVR